VPHDNEMARLPEFLKLLDDAGVDAIIASDIGTIALAKEYAPGCDIHVSVQSGITNSATAREFYKMGAKRIVLARELSLEEIKNIRDNTPEELEIEAFVHGAMCVSFSARCLLSSYMTGRDANRGDCAQPCRWSYSLMEEKRPGQYYDITETDKGTYILNANDMCMAPFLDKMIEAGVDSIKIEGRAKSEYYVAVTANAYRGALDSLKSSDGNWQLPDWVGEELNKISHRTYSTGFYLGAPSNAQTYENAGYIRDYNVAAVVTGYENGYVTAILKNKFGVGTELDCLEAGHSPFKIQVDTLLDGGNNVIDCANSPMSVIKIPYPREIKAGSMLRMKTG
ncbi:MAG: U32 family peptidase C-terminal domain-containing protein, partial [Clostridia bacterium]|nr:U32 family peptidase C-terminal domain-containing protein [Clostridia bacterium]